MRDLKKLPVAALIEMYATAAATHGEATESGDYKTGNRHYRIVESVYRELRSRGLEAQRALLPLLARAEPGVRGWAAAHALEFAPTEGEPVLAALAAVKASLVGLSAEMTLKEWRRGTLRFP